MQDVNHLIREANMVKEVLIDALIQEGLVSKEDGQKFVKEYAITLVQQNLFGNILTKFFKVKQQDLLYRVIKIISYEKQECQDEV